MRILEFGDKTKRKLLLIHGFQMPMELWKPYIARYEKEFHILVPILPGHDLEERTEFSSFEEVAAELEEKLFLYGSIHAVFAMSLGGVLAVTLAQRGRLIFDKLILDGSPLVGYGGFMQRFMTNFYIDVTHKSQAREPKTIRRATEGIIPARYLQEFLSVLDGLSDRSIENYIDGVAKFKLNADMGMGNMEIIYFHGTKMNELLAKKTAKRLEKLGGRIVAFQGKAHCENSIFYPEVMMKYLDEVICL